MNLSEPDPRAAESLLSDELIEAWPALSAEERLEGFRLLTPVEAEELYLGLEARDQV